jgi:hypothetical protein
MPAPRVRDTLLRVLTIQVVTLALLWWLQRATGTDDALDQLADRRRYLLWVVGDSIRRSRGATTLEGYFLAGRSLPWWAVGLSVMATQLSAITLIGTTGQGATDGLRFVQFYFGLPVAMVILGVTIVPFLHEGEGLHGVRVPRAALQPGRAR